MTRTNAGALAVKEIGPDAAPTRVAVLAWVNDILATSYTSFTAIPATELALILYGIFVHEPRAGRHLALNMLDFSTTASPTTCMHNVQHVLRMIQHLSADESLACLAERCEDGSGSHTPAQMVTEPSRINSTNEALCSTAAHGSASPAVTIIGPHLTAVDWIEGRAFVDELKVWRWVRVMAQRMHRTGAAIRQAMTRYLHGGAGSGGSGSSEHVSHTNDHNTSCDHDGDGNSCVGERSEKMACGTSAQSTSPALHTESETERAAAKRNRGGVPPTCGEDEAPRLGPRLEPCVRQEAVDRESSLSGYLLESNSHWTATTSCGDGTNLFGNTRRAVPSEVMTGTPVLRSDGAERAPALYSNLVTATQELRAQLRTRRQAEHSLVADAGHLLDKSSAVPSMDNNSGDCTGAAVTKTTTDDVAAMMHKDLESDGLLRTLEGSGVRSHLQTLTDVNGVVAVPTAEERSWRCQRCPVVFAHALQCNLAMLEEMEQIRKSAIAACVKKDAAALLTALKNFV